MTEFYGVNFHLEIFKQQKKTSTINTAKEASLYRPEKNGMEHETRN